MLFSTVTALTALMISSTMAAPMSSYTRRDMDDESGAFNLDTHCFAIARSLGVHPKRCSTELIGKPLPSIVGGPVVPAQRVYTREDTEDESGAISLDAHCLAIARSLGAYPKRCPTELIGKPLFSIFGGVNGPVQRGYTRQDTEDESGAFSKWSEFACPIIAKRLGVHPKRCPTELIGNHLFDRAVLNMLESRSSGVLSPAEIERIVGAGNDPIRMDWNVNVLSGEKSQRDELLARDEDSGAISLKTIGTIASFAAPVIGGIIDHFTNNQQRDLLLDELLRRSMGDLDALD